MQVRPRADELVKIFCSLLGGADFSHGFFISLIGGKDTMDQFQRYFFDFICNKIFVVEGPDVFPDQVCGRIIPV